MGQTLLMLTSALNIAIAVLIVFDLKYPPEDRDID